MDKTALVGIEVEQASRVVQILDDAGLQVKVALWAFLSDYEDWRFVISSVKFDAEPRRGYGLYHQALEAAGMTLEETPFTMIMNSKDRFIRDLRKQYGKTKRVEGMQIYGQSIGNRFIEDAYVYRIS
jgi:hypothetical protein